MATHFARGILSTGEPLSTRLSAACHQSARRLPEYRQARFRASRSLLAELLFMLYGISELPEIINEANGRPVFSDRHLPRFSISYTGNIVGVALTTEGIVASTWNCSALSAATTPTGKISVTMRICGLTFSMTRTKRAASWWRCGAAC
jgi:phosphopantetheinyl transferase